MKMRLWKKRKPLRSKPTAAVKIIRCSGGLGVWGGGSLCRRHGLALGRDIPWDEPFEGKR